MAGTIGWRTAASLLTLAIALTGCGDGGGGGGGGASGGTPTPTPAATYAITATVSGLDAAGLVLANGGSTFPVAATATSVPIATGVSGGATYAITVQTQPAGETCTVNSGSGTVAANVTVAVSCIHTIGGLRAPRFTETAIDLPAGLLTNPSGMALLDFDSDGDPDLVVVQVAPPTNPPTRRRVLAFRNNAGTFVDVTTAVFGDIQMVNPRRTRVADFNADGRPDLFIAETGTDTDPFPGDQSRLFIQTADGRLADETATRLPIRNDYTHGADVADVNGDGTPDIYMGNYIQSSTPRLYLNNAGRLTDRSDLLPDYVSSGRAETPSGAFCDVTGDNRPELILGGNYFAPTGAGSYRANLLLINDGTGRYATNPGFTLPEKAAGPNSATVDIACADLDGDGAKDVVTATDVSNQMPGLQLLLNDRSGHLRDASANLNLTFSPNELWVVNVTVADINGDNTPDLLLRMSSRIYTASATANSILLNRGNGTFVNASAQLPIRPNNDFAVGDLDRDGVMDIVTMEPNQLRIFKGLRP